MIKPVYVVGSISNVDIGVDVADIVTLAIVVPCGNLDNIGLDGVDGLCPPSVPECVALLDPIGIRGTKVLELPW